MKDVKSISSSIAILGLALLSASSTLTAIDAVAADQDPVLGSANRARNVYSVKFLCGRYSGGNVAGAVFEGPVKPGNYQTAINIHNPHRSQVGFLKKAVLMFDSLHPDQEHEVPKPPGKPVVAYLPPDWGMEIDCSDIREVLLQMPPQTAEPFIKGWVILESSNRVDLDVTAVYSGYGFNVDANGTTSTEGFALDLVTVQPKEVN